MYRAFGAKRGCGGDGWAKGRLGMGAGKEVSSTGGMHGTALTLFDLYVKQRAKTVRASGGKVMKRPFSSA